MLFDSQENAFRKISAALSQSSHSTNFGDLEESLLLDTNSGDSTKDLKEAPCYELRSRSVLKRQKVQPTSTFPASKSPKLSKLPQTDFPPSTEDDEVEDHSQESVSMLQGCYQRSSRNDFPCLMETCVSTELEVIDIYSDEEVELPKQVESTCRLAAIKVESWTQTDLPQSESTHPKESEMMRHARFISSVVKLKAALLSQKTILDEKLSTILREDHITSSYVYGIPTGTMEINVTEQRQGVPKETLDYLVRSSDVENVFRDTVRTLLQHLEDALGDGFLKIACSWQNSVYEIVVEMLRRTADSEPGIWKMVTSFLCRTIESVLNDDRSKVELQNVSLESKTNCLINFCQSTRLSYGVVNCVMRKLKKLKTIQRHNDSRTTNRLCSTYLTKNSYFLLKILESSLELLKSKSDEEKFEGILRKEPEGGNYNVLEMWKKHWKGKGVPDEGKMGHEWETAVSEWCLELDDILIHCVNHVPVLSVAAKRCGVLAKNILNSCHSGVMEDR